MEDKQEGGVQETRRGYLLMKMKMIRYMLVLLCVAFVLTVIFIEFDLRKGRVRLYLAEDAGGHETHNNIEKPKRDQILINIDISQRPSKGSLRGSPELPYNTIKNLPTSDFKDPRQAMTPRGPSLSSQDEPVKQWQDRYHLNSENEHERILFKRSVDGKHMEEILKEAMKEEPVMPSIQMVKDIEVAGAASEKDPIDCGETSTIDDATLVLSNMTYGQAWCNVGFESTGGDFRVTLICIDGQWISSDSTGPVPPVCVPSPGISPLDDMKCDDFQIPNGIITMQTSTNGYIECTEGYTSSSGMMETQFMCFQSNWTFNLLAEGKMVECLPDEPCSIAKLPEMSNGEIVLNDIGLSSPEGVCHDGYTFLSGDSSSHFICTDGVWSLPAIHLGGCRPMETGGYEVVTQIVMAVLNETPFKQSENMETILGRSGDSPNENYEVVTQIVTLPNEEKDGIAVLNEITFKQSENMETITDTGGDSSNENYEVVTQIFTLPNKEKDGMAVLNETTFEQSENMETITETGGDSSTENNEVVMQIVILPNEEKDGMAVLNETTFEQSENTETALVDGMTLTQDDSRELYSYLVSSPSLADVQQGDASTTEHNEIGSENNGISLLSTSGSYSNLSPAQFNDILDTYSEDTTLAEELEYSVGSQSPRSRGSLEDQYNPIEFMPGNGPIYCSRPYPTINNAYVTVRIEGVTVICNPLYSFPSGWKEAILFCHDGQWILPWKYVGDATGCVEEVNCTRGCENGGRCTGDNTCWCNPGYHGQYCESKQCKPLPLVVYNAALTASQNNPVATCHFGYTFGGGEVSLEFQCVDGEWDIPERYTNKTEATCLAVCDPPCEHGGKCIEPGLCRCPVKYVGDNCEVLKCTSPPPFVKNADIEYNPTISRAKCLTGYQFSNGNTSLNIECLNGEWKPAFCEDEVNHQLVCEPVCHDKCKNGGTCVAPDSCACPVPFDGPQCTEYRDNTCESPPPVVLKAKMNYTMTLGEAECISGYALATGETSIKLVCNYGEWKFPIPALQSPECLPVCAGGCQNGGVCKDANVCKCVKPYTGLLCQDVAMDICPTPPAPIPNAIMHISPFNILVTCRAGYALPSENTQTELWCMNNQWAPAIHSDQRGHPVTAEDTTKPLACFPTCDPPCQNEGICVGINKCQCQSPFTGGYCQDMMEEYCWEEPPPFENAYVNYNSSRATVTCKDGYMLPNLQTKLTLTCSHGQWTMEPGGSETPICSPTCVPPCDNEGVCTAPNTCTCNRRFYGNHCQERRCSTVPAAILNSYVSAGIDGTAVLSCFDGFIMNTGTHQMMLDCDDGFWLTIETTPRTVDELECSPFCSQLCLNGGTCAAPNLCHCTEKYAGRYCQFERCADMPITDPKAVISLSDDLTSAEVSCQKNYRLSTGHLSLEFHCRNGRWLSPEGFYITSDIICSPLCPKGCANGGECVAPNTCQCPEGFLGSTCNKRYGITVEGDACVFPFLYNSTWYQACTTVNSNHPWCASEVTGQGYVTKWGFCVADLGDEKLVTTIRKDICTFPFIYNGERYYGCTTSKDRPKPWCATKLDGTGLVIQWDVCDLYYGVDIVILTVTGDTCKFPFLHSGKQYNKCVDDEVEREIYPWCATETSVTGMPMETGTCKLDWGVVEITVTINNHVCLFPFNWRNQTVYSCLPATAGRNGPWCATKIDKDRKMSEWDECYIEDDGPFIPPVGTGTFDPPTPIGPRIINITTVNGFNCVVPFMHKGKKQNGCVKEGFEQPWCATSVDSDLHVVTDDTCPINWDLPSTPPTGLGTDQHGPIVTTVNVLEVVTIHDEPCIFPFRYKGIMYHGCIQLESDQPFCATEVDHNSESIATDTCPDDWDTGLDNSPHEVPGLSPGVSCIFPFIQDGVEYKTCIKMGLKQVCATKVNHQNVALEYGTCPDELVLDSDTPVTADGEKCKFPFIYKGVQYNRCIQDGNEYGGNDFCATEVDIGGVTIFTGICQKGGGLHGSGDREKVVTTVLGKTCKFPFTYQGIEYNDCACVGSSRPFCATKVDYTNAALETDYCSEDWNQPRPGFGGPKYPMETIDGGHCITPFVFEGTTYYGCITQGSKGPFCATEVDHNRKALRTTFCHDDWDKDIGGGSGQFPVITTTSGKQCFITVIHKGIKSKGCIITQESVRPVCGTAVDSHLWMTESDFCPSDWENLLFTNPGLETEDGQKCIFPFKYEEKIHHECICEEEKRYWCATNVDDDLAHTTWGYCKDHADHPGGDSDVEDYWPSPNEPNVDWPHPGGSGVDPNSGSHGGPTQTINGLECVFHFVWQGKKYNSCITNKHGRPWCATSVDAHRHVKTSDICYIQEPVGGDNDQVDHPPRVCRHVKTTDGKECILPFKHNGIWHDKCILLSKNASPVCAVHVDAHSTVVVWGTCPHGWHKKPIATHRSLQTKPEETSTGFIHHGYLKYGKMYPKMH